MNNVVREYALQLMHQPIKFTCNGYMDINLGYYGKVKLNAEVGKINLIR